MKLILHPGHAKCGSSSIQSWLKLNLKSLGDRGILVPDSNFTFRHDEPRVPVSTYQYFLRVIESADETRFQKDLTKLVAEGNANGGSLVISEEFLTDPRVVSSGSFIHRLLAEAFDSIRVCYYLRRQDDFAVSSWQQWGHKTGNSLGQEIVRALEHHEPDYLKNIRFLESCYGKSNVVVGLFNPEFLYDGDLIRDFCHSTSLDYGQHLALPRRENASLNPYICEILAHSSEALYQNDWDDYQLRGWLEELGDDSIAWQVHKEYMRAEQRISVLRHFEADNRVIHAERFSHINFENIFGFEPLAKNYDEVEGLKMAVSLQFEILYKLLNGMKLNELRLREETTRLTQSLVDYEKQTELLLNSKSWRLTKPLRTIWRRFV